jgi:ABC-type antimicrobial peptide transport system permease subunit
MALGAHPRNILAGVLTEGLVIAAIGVTSGIVTGFAFARILGKYVAEVQQPGLLAFFASAIVILTAAVVASAVPAARAARINAVEALRAE